MKHNLFKVTAFAIMMALLLVSTFSQQLQAVEDIKIEESTQPINVPSEFDTPFKKDQNQKHKRHHSGDVKRGAKDQEEGEQRIYKPFPTKDDEEDQDQNDSFAQMMFWGMTIGSVFLAVVLCKSCMKKRGRCGRRHQMTQQMAQQNLNINNPYNHYVQRNFNPIVRVPVQGRPFEQVQIQRPVSNTSQIDNKIQKYQAELNQLKQLKQKTLRDELLRRNLQKQMPMERVHNHNQNYGPRYYGDKPLERRPYQPATDYSLSSNQPFQVQGIDPILPRRRVNSINTQAVESERNGVYYRNGIPIGKPLNQQDNDSSFASQYPQI